MAYYQCQYCKASSFSDKDRMVHEIRCPQNPGNIKMTSKQFKKRMQLT